MLPNLGRESDSEGEDESDSEQGGNFLDDFYEVMMDSGAKRVPVCEVMARSGLSEGQFAEALSCWTDLGIFALKEGYITILK